MVTLGLPKRKRSRNHPGRHDLAGGYHGEDKKKRRCATDRRAPFQFSVLRTSSSSRFVVPCTFSVITVPRINGTLLGILKFRHSLQSLLGGTRQNELVIDKLELRNRDGDIVLDQAEKAARIDDGI